VNTEGDELFPFLKDANDILFFSSNGRFGWEDWICLFASSWSRHRKVYNAGYPLNTISDDFALIVSDITTKDIFSSNRSGGGGVMIFMLLSFET